MAEVTRKAKGSIEMTVGIWRNKESGEIMMTLPHGKMSYVTDNPNSKRCHPHLFNKLKEILIAEGRW